MQAILIGGSFVHPSTPAPRDIDCLMFYRAVAAGAIDARRLGDVQRKAKRMQVDARFIPTDGPVLPLINAVSYFTTLFSMSRSEEAPVQHQTRGLVLLDCS